MKKVFLKPGEEFRCPYCKAKTIYDVKRTIYFSSTINTLSASCKLNTFTSGGKTKIEDAKSICASCGGNVYKDLVSKNRYTLPDELFEI